MTNEYPWLSPVFKLFDHWGQNLPSAILFVGQTQVALHAINTLVSRFICDCQTCEICQQLADQLHPQVNWIGFEQDKAIGVDTIRELIKKVSLASQNKHFFILEAPKLHTASTNAFLKTLEEPNVNCHFLLVAPAAQGLLPTLVSRCVQCTIPQPNWDQGMAYLQAHGASGVEAEQALRRFHSPLIALENLEPEQAATVLQWTDAFFNLMDKKTDPVSFAEALLNDSPKKALYLYHSLVSDLCLIGAGAPSLVKNQQHLDKLAAIAQRVPFVMASQWLQAWNRAAKALTEPSCNPKLVLTEFAVALKH